MSINSLEETEGDPDIDGENVQVACKVAVEDRPRNSTRAENENLCWVGVFSGEAKGCGIFMMEFVNVLVQNPGMQCLMS